jgi:hypothetical protein
MVSDGPISGDIDGSPLDAAVHLVLILAALAVLVARGGKL